VYDSGNYIVLETNLRKEYSVSNWPAQKM
jgi:hypothetical protein